MTGLRHRLRAMARVLLLLLPLGVFATFRLATDADFALAAAGLAALGAYALWRRRADARVRQDRARLARLVDALPLATVAYDGTPRILTWNRSAAALFGWDADEVVGRAAPIVPADLAAQAASLHARIMSGELLHGVEVKRQARDGSLLDLNVFSSLIDPGAGPAGGFLAVYDDIGERKRAERERDAAEQRYRGLVEALPLVTYVDRVDDDSTNLYTSPQVEQLLGWPLSAWQDDPLLFHVLLHPDDRERVIDLLHETNAARAPFEAEYRLRHRDGHYVWVRDHSTIVEEDDGAVSARGFLLDITEQKRLEEQLLQAQKMDALGQFAGGIAHDFNNLLTGIGGYADLAGASAEPGPAVRRSLEGIKSAADEAAGLTSRLLAFSRRHVTERRPVHLNDVVHTATEDLRRLEGTHAAVRLELFEPLPPVSADAAQLEQVVLNLVHNAWDATSPGGTVLLETETDGEQVVLRVNDDGCGMDDAVRRRALEPFFTTKEEGEGAGLGLSVVYGVVASLGGTVAIESSAGRGTTVEVVLPATAALTGPAPADAVKPPATCSPRVLVVEDRDVVRALAQDVLEAAGFDVATAAGGEEAARIALDAEPFHLLLTDVVMPGMSGPELAAHLRTGQAGLPVIFMSGYTDDVLDRSLLGDPATAFLPKPFGNAELVESARALLEAQPCASAAFANAPSVSPACTG